MEAEEGQPTRKCPLIAHIVAMILPAFMRASRWRDFIQIAR
jgi:hypothetical protein